MQVRHVPVRTSPKLPQSWQQSPDRRGANPVRSNPCASGGHASQPPGGLGSRQPQSRTLPPWSRLQIIDSVAVQRQRPCQHPAQRHREVLHPGGPAARRPTACLHPGGAEIILVVYRGFIGIVIG